MFGDVAEPGLGEPVDDVAELGPGGVAVGLLEDRPDQRGDHRPRRPGDLGGQVGHEVGSAPLPGRSAEHRRDRRLDPAVGVGDDQLHPGQPRATSDRRNAVHAGGVSVVTMSNPTISRRPSTLTAVAITAETFTTRPPSRTFCVNASIHRYRYGPASRGVPGTRPPCRRAPPPCATPPSGRSPRSPSP